MIEQLHRRWGGPWLLIAGMAAIALLLILSRGVLEHPLFSDRAYFVYVGQAVLRGEPYYQTTFMGYPPLGALSSALSMWVGQAFGVPTYLAPRYLSVAVGVATVVLLSILTRRAVGSAMAATLAGVALAGLHWFGILTIGTLEPKSLVGLFMLAGGIALQGRHWLTVGLCAGLAGTSYQPGVVVVVALLMGSAFCGRGELRSVLPRLLAGLVLAALPSILYLLASGSFWDFVERSIVIPAAVELPGAGRKPFRFVGALYGSFSADRVVLLSSAIGFVWFALTAAVRGPRVLASRFLDARLGGIPMLTLGWLFFCIFNYQATPDAIPFMPIIAFWAAWVTLRVVDALADRVPRPSPRGHVVRESVLGLLAVAMLVRGAVLAVRYEPPVTLAEQRETILELIPPDGPTAIVWAFGAESIYVLTERPTPNRFLRIDRPFGPHFARAEPRGCNGLLLRLDAEKPDPVVVHTPRGPSACLARLLKRMKRAGYVTDEHVWAGFVRWSIHRRGA